MGRPIATIPIRVNCVVSNSILLPLPDTSSSIRCPTNCGKGIWMVVQGVVICDGVVVGTRGIVKVARNDACGLVHAVVFKLYSPAHPTKRKERTKPPVKQRVYENTNNVLWTKKNHQATILYTYTHTHMIVPTYCTLNVSNDDVVVGLLLPQHTTSNSIP
jgi:hypothetical protein